MRAAIYFRHLAPLVAFFSLFALFVLVVPPAHARGRLVKGSLPAVYYLGTDGDRYVFPNERIYGSWYPDFSDVDEVSDTELARYALGGNVTYRPGTRLVKLTNDPKVYAVEPGGVLRWVTSETVAEDTFGTGWAGRVDDLPDGFFPAYSIGEDLDEARYPEGTLLEVGGTYYVVWAGSAHELTEDAIEDNGIQTGFALSVSETGLPEGDRITIGKSYLYDTAQIGLGETLEAAVEGEESTFDTTVAQGTDDAVIGALVVSVREETAMRDPRVTIEARTSADDDADEGGLIRGDGDEQMETNVQRIRITDASGTSLFGTEQLGVADGADDEQTLSFSGSVTLRPGRHVLFVVADLDNDAPADERYQTTFELAETDWLVNGALTDDVDPETIESDPITVVEGYVSVTRDATVASESTLRGVAGPFDVAGFAFDSSLDEDVVLTRLVLTAYVDANEGSTDFAAGTDSDVSGTLSASEIVESVSVVRASDGEVLATSSDFGSGGSVTFEGRDWLIAGGEETTFLVRVVLDEDAPTGLESDRLAFDISSAEDVDVEDADGDAVTVDVDAPNGGTSPKTILTVAASGSLGIDGSGSPYEVVVMGADEVPFYELTLSAGDEEDILVHTLSFRYVDQDAPRNVEDATLRVGTTDYDGAGTGSGITFSDLALVVPAGDDVDAEVLLDMASSSQGAVSGDEVGIAFEPSTLSAEGAISGATFDADDVGDTVTEGTAAGEEAVIRRNLPVVAIVSDGVATEQDEDDETGLLRFTMESIGEGTSKLESLAFKIEPNDVGESGSDNDLLEKLADVNGDGKDDNDVATLLDDTEGDELGEGSDGHIDFFIYDKSANARDATPAGLDTATGDYGVIVIEFTTSHTLWSAPHEYVFMFRTIGIEGDNPSLKATLLGGADFVWSDGSSSTAEQDGTSVDGLPIAGPTVRIE